MHPICQNSLNSSITLQWGKEERVLESKHAPKSTFFQAIFSGIAHGTCSFKTKNVCDMTQSKSKELYVSKELYDCLVKIYSMEMEIENPKTFAQRIKEEWKELTNKTWNELSQTDWNQLIKKIKEELIEKEQCLKEWEWKMLIGEEFSQLIFSDGKKNKYSHLLFSDWKKIVEKDYENMTKESWRQWIQKQRKKPIEPQKTKEWEFLFEQSWKELTVFSWYELIEKKWENTRAEEWKALVEKIEKEVNSRDWEALSKKKWNTLTISEWNVMIKKTCEELINTAIKPLLEKEEVTTVWFNEIQEKLNLLFKGSCEREISEVFRKLCLYDMLENHNALEELIIDYQKIHQGGSLPLMIQEAIEAREAIDKAIKDLKGNKDQQLKDLKWEEKKNEISQKVLKQRCEETLSGLKLMRLIEEDFKYYYPEGFPWRCNGKADFQFIITSRESYRRTIDVEGKDVYEEDEEGNRIREVPFAVFPHFYKYKKIKEQVEDFNLYKNFLKNNPQYAEIYQKYVQPMTSAYSTSIEQLQEFKSWGLQNKEIIFKKLEEMNFPTQSFPLKVNSFPELIVKVTELEALTQFLYERRKKSYLYHLALQADQVSWNELNDLFAIINKSSNNFLLFLDAKIVPYKKEEKETKPKKPEFPQNLFFSHGPLHKLFPILEKFRLVKYGFELSSEEKVEKCRYSKAFLAHQLDHVYVHPSREAESLLGEELLLNKVSSSSLGIAKICCGGIHGVTPQTLFLLFHNETLKLSAVAEVTRLDWFYSTIKMKWGILEENASFLDYHIYIHYKRQFSKIESFSHRTPYFNWVQKKWEDFMDQAKKRAEGGKDLKEILFIPKTEEKKEFRSFQSLLRQPNVRRFRYEPNIEIAIPHKSEDQMFLVFARNAHKTPAIVQGIEQEDTLPVISECKDFKELDLNIKEEDDFQILSCPLKSDERTRKITVVAVRAIGDTACGCLNDPKALFNFEASELHSNSSFTDFSDRTIGVSETNQHEYIASTFHLIFKHSTQVAQREKNFLNTFSFEEAKVTLKDVLEEIQKNDPQMSEKVQNFLSAFYKEEVKNALKCYLEIKKERQSHEDTHILTLLDRWYYQPLIQTQDIIQAFLKEHWHLVKQLYQKLEDSLDSPLYEDPQRNSVIQALFSKVKIRYEVAQQIEDLKSAFLNDQWSEVLKIFGHLKNTVQQMPINHKIHSLVSHFKKEAYQQAMDHFFPLYHSSYKKLEEEWTQIKQSQITFRDRRLFQWLTLTNQIEEMKETYREFLKEDTQLHQQLQDLSLKVENERKEEEKELQKEFEKSPLKQKWVTACLDNNQKKADECYREISQQYSCLPQLFLNLYLNNVEILQKGLNQAYEEQKWENVINFFDKIRSRFPALPKINWELYTKLKEKYDKARLYLGEEDD